jgi:hypothetical protein
MKAINLYHYRYIDEFYSTNKVIDKGQLGFIAQNVSSIFPKAISVIPEYGYDDLLVLNPSQIHLAHYGATRKLMDVIEVQSTTIQNQQTDINLLKSQVMHLFNYVSANIMRGD